MGLMHRIVCLFPPSFRWYSFCLLWKDGQTSLNRWMIKYQMCECDSNLRRVTHPSINRARRRGTALIETNALYTAAPNRHHNWSDGVIKFSWGTWVMGERL